MNRPLAIGILASVYLFGLSACVSPGPPLHHFAITAASGGPIANQAMGVPFSIKITAQDSSNKTVTSFTGKVNITSTGTLSAGGGTTAAFVNGVLASHSVTIGNQGSFTLTATRTGGSETGTSNAFTVDAAPSVSNTTPANGATGVPLVSSITINFSESVNASTASFALECPTGTAKAFSLSASPASSFTLTPVGGLPSGTTCQVRVIAAQVSDVDSNDPPDTMAADHSFSFTTAAASPSTSTITANPTSITANGAATSTITVQLKDSGGNNLSSSGGVVALSTTAGTLSPVSDNNNGSYTATLTAPTTVGTATISATLNGTPLSNTASVSFVAGPLHHFAIEAQGGGNIGNQAANNPFNIRVTAQDSSNNTVTSFTGTVDITSTGTLSAGGGTTAAFVGGVLASHSVTISNTGSFTITATRTGGSESGTSNAFAVNLVNIAPSFTKGPDQTVLEDAGPQTVNPWATAISPGPPNEAGQTLTFVVTGNTNPTLFSAGPAVSPTGVLTYTPAANANGSATITLVLKDDGGTAGGGQDTSAPQTFSITVTPVNDAPSFTKGGDQTVNEDAGAQTVNGWATAISAGPNESGQTLTFNITGNTNAALFSAAPAVSSTGVLTYTPAPNANGSATLTLTLSDDGGTANGGQNTSAAQTFVITVTPVNDAPSFTKGANQTVNEDAGAQTVNPWATAISPGPANESGQTVSFVVSNNNNGLFSAQPAVSPTGVLTYTPAANQNGNATVSVQIKDNGGTANGGVDTSAAQTFTITVNAVNDPPVAQTKTASAQANMKIVGVNPGLLTGVTDADAGISGCSPTFSVASISASSGGTVSNVNLAAGTFDFEPAPGFVGTAVVNYTVSDSGCPGTATSAPATINITVSGPVIWFVNPASATNGNGTLNSPFNNLASADAVDASGHRIFVYNGTTPTASITLNTNEWLIGQGVTGTSFDSFFGITPPAGTIARPSINGTRPVIQGNVTMASSDAVRGLNIQPASGTQGLFASGATGLTVGEVSVTTTNATAVSLTNSDGTFSFTSISASGGPNGIVWNNASPATGSFTVNGDGSNTSVGGNASGGTISNATGGDGTTAGIGVYLNNAQNVTLRRMTISGTNQNFGIRGLNVTNFTLEYATVGGVNGTSTPNREGSVIFDNLFGANAITSSIISGAIEDNLRVENTSGTLTAFNLTNSRIQNNSTVSGNVGFRFATATPGVSMTGTVSGSTFQGNRTIAIQTDASNGTVNFTATNNTIIAGTGGNNQGNQGIEVDVANNGVMTFAVSGNKIGTDGITNQPLLNTGINIFNGTLVTSGTPAIITGTVTNNTVYNAGAGFSGFGIRLFNQGYGTMNANVSNNTVNNVGLDYGIFAEVSSNSGTANAAGSSSIGMTNNTSNVLSGGLDAIRLQARGRSTMCARISGNASSTHGTGFFGLEIRQAAQTVSAVIYQATFNLEGLTSGLQTDHTLIVNYLNSQNPGIVGGADEIHSAGITGVAANSCSSIP